MTVIDLTRTPVLLPAGGGASADASELTTGTLDPLRLPRGIWNTVSAVTSGTVFWGIDSEAVSCPYAIDITCNHDSGVNAPTGKPLNHQVIRISAHANGGTRTWTFADGYRLSTGLTSRRFTIPSGQVLLAAIEYSTLIGAWVLTAATVSG